MEADNDVLHVAEQLLATFGQQATLRDFGLLASAVARPRSAGFGVEAYPEIFEKAAALLNSLAGNHCFVDGNKRTAWTSTVVFLTINGREQITPVDEDAAEDLVLAAAHSHIEVDQIAERLRGFFA